MTHPAGISATPFSPLGDWVPDGGGANYGLEAHPPSAGALTPPGRGVMVDPEADGKPPFQPWARDEREARNTPLRGYDDPTAHCFAAGVPRSMYVPSPFHIVQTPDHVVLLFERMAWRIVPLNGRPSPGGHPSLAG